MLESGWLGGVVVGPKLAFLFVLLDEVREHNLASNLAISAQSAASVPASNLITRPSAPIPWG